MSKIKMLQSIPGALNGGLNVKLFKVGLVYETEDMEGLDEIFLDNNFAEKHVTPDEVIRHQRGLSGAPANKRETVPDNKKPNLNFDDLHDDEDKIKGVKFTAEELEGAKAGDIRTLGKQHNVDLSDLAVNTSALVLIEEYLKRQ